MTKSRGGASCCLAPKENVMKINLFKILMLCLLASLMFFAVSCTTTPSSESKTDSEEESTFESQIEEKNYDLSNFYYEMTSDTTCTITGVKDAFVTDVYIPSCVTKIEADVFVDCINIQRVHTSSLEAWCNIEFEMDFENNIIFSNPMVMAYLNNSFSELIVGDELLNELVIPEGVTEIKQASFIGCASVTSIVLGNNVKSIGNFAFLSCVGLTNVIIGDDVTAIGSSAFAGCTSLISVIIPDSVTIIGDYAFEYCTSLTSVVIPNSVTTIGMNVFADCASMKYNEYGNCKYLGNENNPYYVLMVFTSTNDNSYYIHEDTK